ncbi:MAG TPA: sigma-70 family RNA polymerase sigma factor [Chthonomonadaceae bacterium]|nr:sigma-70 family RNA polymerase sigma factor [Chthonomonadaceae bacterium]
MSVSVPGDSSDKQSRKEYDGWLLRRYVEQGSQGAFNTLVRRHLQFVYATCLREVRDPELAQDVTMAVFLVLSRKARTLRAGAVLTSWLFQTARLASRNALRKEQNRMRQERKLILQAAEQYQTARAGSDLWDRIEPYVNGALAALRAPERDILLQRYLEGRSLKETGQALGLTEDAARMRISRALEKVRRHLAKAGIALSAAALGALLIENASKATVPPTLLDLITGNPAGGTVSVSSLTARSLHISKGALHAMNVMQSQKLALTTLLVAALGTISVIQTADVLNARRAEALKAEIQKSARAIDTLTAHVSTSYTLGGITHVYEGNIQLKRPNQFRVEVGPPYNKLVLSDGKEVYTITGVGTSREAYQKETVNPGETSVQRIDDPLAYLFMTADLDRFRDKLFREQAPLVDAGTEKRNGVLYRLLEIRGSKDRHLVRLYVQPNGLVTGMYTETEINSVEETPDGNRTMKRAWMTGVTFLRGVQTGKLLSDAVFAFQRQNVRPTEERPSFLTAGAAAPPFEVTDPVDNTKISLAAMLREHRVVLVNFWFLGCPPCRAEFPRLQALYNEFKNRGFDMVSINGTDDSKAIRAFFREQRYTFPAGIAPHKRRRNIDDLAWQYGVQAYPTNFLIGPDGRVLWSGIGFDERALRAAITQAGLP